MLDRPTIKDALRAKSDCLTPQELEKLAEVRDENPAPKNAHLEQCPRCQTELALLKSFESSEPLPGEGAAVAWISKRLEQRLDQIKGAQIQGGTVPREADASAQADSWLSRLFGDNKARWLIPAAAAFLILVAIVAVMNRPQEPQLRADAGQEQAIYRSQEVEVTGPVGELKAEPETLRWKAFTGAARYKISIMEVDEVSLWSGETSDLTVTIPASVRARMLPGKPVLWRVTALDAQGRFLAASQVQRFSVQLKSS